MNSKKICDELKCEDIFIQNNGKEIFLNRIYSACTDIEKNKSIILAPGLGNNANIFRIYNMSFADMLASAGFVVYLYHPGYAENIYNNYVSKYCKDSKYYGKRYKAPSTLGIDEIVNVEMPVIIEYVYKNSQEKQVSWIGYSMGGMIIYFYFSKQTDDRINRIVTIGSPFSGSQIFTHVVPLIDSSYKLSYKIIKYLPTFLMHYNLGSLLFFNPLNIDRIILKRFLDTAIEPYTDSLKKYFSNKKYSGFSSQTNYSEFVKSLQYLTKTEKKFLFFFGSNDMVANPNSIFLVHNVISPGDKYNLIEVNSSGHFDLLLGKNAKEKVWIPAVKWLNMNAGN